MLHRWKSVSRQMALTLLGLSLMGGIAAVAPTNSYAIPVAGNYAFTSGLTGTFTSDGSKLTVWDIVGPLGGNFVTGSTVLNNSLAFTQGVFPSLAIVWNLNPNVLTGAFTEVKVGAFPAKGTFGFRAVPEASTIVLGALGFVGVMAFSWRRRQASYQIG